MGAEEQNPGLSTLRENRDGIFGSSRTSLNARIAVQYEDNLHQSFLQRRRLRSFFRWST